MLNFQKKLSNLFFAVLSFPTTAMGFALSVQIAALSWILGTQYGFSIEDIGLVWAAGPIAGIFGQVIFGLVSDNVWFWNGRRRPFILIGGVLATLSLLALPNIGIISGAMGTDALLGVAIAVALSLDLSINIGFNPTRSIIADATPEGAYRTKGYTWMQTISGTVSMGAYVIGAIWGNYTLIYAGAAIVFLLSVIPPFFIEEPRHLKGNEEEIASSTSLVVILNSIRPLWGFALYALYGILARLLNIEPNVWVELFCLLITLVLVIQTLFAKETGKSKIEAGFVGFRKVLAAHSFTWIGVQAMFIYMVPYLQFKFPEMASENVGRTVSISFLILNAVGAILPAFVLEPLTKKMGSVRVHFLCIASMALGYAGLLFLSTNTLLIYIWMAVLGIGWASTISLPFAIMSQQIDKSRMGLYMGLFNLSVVLPQLVASLGVGKIVGQVENKSIVFVICTVTLLVSALSWFFVKEKIK